MFLLPCAPTYILEGVVAWSLHHARVVTSLTISLFAYTTLYLLHSGKLLHATSCIYLPVITSFIQIEDNVNFKCGGGLHACGGVESVVNRDL